MTPCRPWLDGHARARRRSRATCAHLAPTRPCGGTCCEYCAPSRRVSRADRESRCGRARPRDGRNRPEQLLARRGPRVGEDDAFGERPVELGDAAERRRGARALQPFIAEQQHGLRQAERGELRIDRRGDDGVGERDDVVVEAAPLGAEQHTGQLGAVGAHLQLACGAFGRQHGLHHLARPRRGGEHVVEPGDRLLDGRIDARLLDDIGGAGGGGMRLVVGPAVARLDQPEIGQAEIRHGAGGKADILAELRLDEDDRRRSRHGRAAPARAQ